MVRTPAPAPEPAAPIDLAARAETIPAHDSTLNVHQRMILVAAAIERIEKAGTGPSSQGSYAFARDQDIKDRVRQECLRVGLAIHPSIPGRDVQLIAGSDRDGKARTSVLATVWGTLTFVNIDDPADRWTNEIHGQGIDTQDKALSKATTSAIKYGLLNAFTIPTGDDPDAAGHDLPSGGSGTSQGARSRPRPTPPPRGASAEPSPFPDEPPFPGEERPASYAAAADAADDPGKCPKHSIKWRPGQYGYYCPAKDDTTDRGYCTLKPTEAWVSANAR